MNLSFVTDFIKPFYIHDDWNGQGSDDKPKSCAGGIVEIFIPLWERLKTAHEATVVTKSETNRRKNTVKFACSSGFQKGYIHTEVKCDYPSNISA